MRDKTCRACHYWRDDKGVPGTDKPVWCWRYPPTVMISVSGEFKRDRPVMSGWEWCGEFLEKSPAKATRLGSEFAVCASAVVDG